MLKPMCLISPTPFVTVLSRVSMGQHRQSRRLQHSTKNNRARQGMPLRSGKKGFEGGRGAATGPGKPAYWAPSTEDTVSKAKAQLMELRREILTKRGGRTARRFVCSNGVTLEL